MESSVKSWGIALGLIASLALVTFVFGLFSPFPNAAPPLSRFFICFISASVLGHCFWNLSRLLRRRIVAKESQTLAFSNGQTSILAPAGSVEIWIFSRVSFAQYHGKVSFEESGRQFVLNLPRRNPLCYPVRANSAPIVWKYPEGPTRVPKKFTIKFELKPSFAGTSFDSRVDLDDFGTITIVIKAMRS